MEFKRDEGCGHKRQSKGGDTGRAYLAGEDIYRHTTDADREGRRRSRSRYTIWVSRADSGWLSDGWEAPGNRDRDRPMGVNSQTLSAKLCHRRNAIPSFPPQLLLSSAAGLPRRILASAAEPPLQISSFLDPRFRSPWPRLGFPSALATCYNAVLLAPHVTYI